MDQFKFNELENMGTPIKKLKDLPNQLLFEQDNEVIPEITIPDIVDSKYINTDFIKKLEADLDNIDYNNPSGSVAVNKDIVKFNEDENKDSKSTNNLQFHDILILIKEPFVMIMLFIILNHSDVNFFIKQISHSDNLYVFLGIRAILFVVLLYLFRKLDI